jgi:mannosylglycerate hydrolase
MIERRRYTGYLIPHTHWDREWYQPLQVFRARLIDVIDTALELLRNDPEYRCFTLDGQAIVLEDYLEIRPERREELRQLVQAGRLRVGPWYVLADEFLVSPESLIRNLQRGHAVSQEFGRPMGVAYTPDSFGHISQLPLLASGFGLDSIVFERGVGDEGERLRGEFQWIAADGQTGVFAAHLLGTYSAAAALGHKDWEFGDSYDRERAVEQMKVVLYGAGEGPPELPQWLHESFQRVAGGITAYSTNGALILLNGSDHLFPQRNIPEIIRDLNEAFPEVEFVHADVEAFVAHARRPLQELEAYQGEFRSSRYQHVLSGVLSARMYLKQANHQAETLLERYAEPLAVLAFLEGAPYPHALLQHAWRTLMENHPHDSICGCSVDSVHREMMTRFESVIQLGSDLCRRSFQQLAGPAEKGYLTVFNPVPEARTATVEAEFELPEGTGHSLVVTDPAGRPLTTQVDVETVFAAGRSDRHVDRVKLRLKAPLPALSTTSFQLTTGDASSPDTSPPPENRLKATADGEVTTLENGALRVEIDSDGAITVLHKATGTSYPLHLRFEDTADAGDEYDYSPLPGDTPIYLTHARERPILLEQGPVRATVRLEYEMTLPARLSADRRGRFGTTQLPIALELSLDAHDEKIQLVLACINQAEDHRLRVIFSSGCQTDHVWADGHFDVLKRPVRPPEGGHWFQKPQPTSHQRRFVAVSDDQRGLAVFNRGLPEYQAIPAASGVDLAVTLLRCVGWLSRDDLISRPQGAGPSMATPEGQCLGTHRFELALYPFSGPWWESRLSQEAEAFTAPPRAYLSARAAKTGDFLALTPPLTLSALKLAENRESALIRVWNPAPVPVGGSMSFFHKVREAYRVRLDETREETLAFSSPTLDLHLGPKQVMTLELVFDQGFNAEGENLM